MTKSKATFLTVAAALLLTTLIGGYYVTKKYIGPIAMQTKSAMDDGKVFAANTDNNGCVAEANTRFGSGGNEVQEGMKGLMFLSACLRESKPTPGFCDSVPSSRDVKKATPWQREQCDKIGAEKGVRCPLLMGAVQQHCHGQSIPS